MGMCHPGRRTVYSRPPIRSAASSSTHDRPWRLSRRAAESPLTPAPTIATSTLCTAMASPFRQIQQTAQRKLGPARTVVQLVKQLVQGLLDQVHLEQQLQLLRVFRQETAPLR